MPAIKEKVGLTGNQLKLIAMLTMTIDHVGLVLLPQHLILRILGRLSFPIYAYMIAEGCRYTHSKGRYFLRLFGLGMLCQVVYYFAMGSLYQCILITFSLSVGLIFLMEWAGKQNKTLGTTAALAGFLAAGFLCIFLPMLLPDTDYGVDYGFLGVCLPVFIWAGRTKKEKLLACALGLTLLALECGGIQWFSLAAVPLLALYSGQRGKHSIGKLFYIYYPAHLAAIYGISLLL